MTDRELLELAAKAIGKDSRLLPFDLKDWTWNPLEDDGDALRLAVRLQIVAGKYDDYASACALGNPVVGEVTVWGHEEKDPYAATRRAIVRAAAELGLNLTIAQKAKLAKLTPNAQVIGVPQHETE